MKLFVLLILAMFASEKKEIDENDPKNGERREDKIGENSIVVKIEDEYVEVNKKSKYFGVSYHMNSSKWRVQRRSKDEKKLISNGGYDDEEIAAHASDTLARKLMENGKQKLKLNFPDEHTEVYPEERSSKCIGVSYDKISSKWRAYRWSKDESKGVTNGYYSNEKTAAHASDTLARNLMENGEQKHKLNFPDDFTEVCREKKTSKFIGVSYKKEISKWRVQRWNKDENTVVHNGCYDDEKTAAHASDTLARKLMENGKQKHKLNFPDDFSEVCRENQKKKRKRPKDSEPQNN